MSGNMIVMLLHKKHSHPTRDALIEAVVWLLETKNPEDIKLDEVLSLSGISSGSLYHHFGDLSGLIDQAMIARYSDDVDISISALTQMVSHATDASSLARGLLPTTERTQSPERSAQRLIRAQTMARAATNERFRTLFEPEQQRLNDAIADLVRELQSKGLFESSVDAEAAAVLIQAYNLGFIINDVSGKPVNQQSWVNLISRMLERTFFSE